MKIGSQIGINSSTHPPSRTSLAGTESVDPLRLDRCPDCGYLLQGLPEQGICPECGFAYRPDMIVLYGWAGHVGGDASTQKRSRQWWTSSVAKWLLLLLLFHVLALIVLIVHLSWSAYRRKRLLSDAPAPVQLRLFAEGFAQRNGVGPVRLRSWRRNKQQLFFKHSGVIRCQVRSWRHMRLVLLRSRVVDFEFRCSVNTLREIQERIDRWRSQAQR